MVRAEIRMRRKLLLLTLLFLSDFDRIALVAASFGLVTTPAASATGKGDENHGSTKEGSILIRHRSRVAYDGNGFAGFQYQAKNTRTVQGELEDVLSRRFNRSVRVLGAGRTDSGVHARGQAFHFDLTPDECSPELDLRQLENSMNKMLTKDLRVWNVSPAPPPFDIKHQNGTVTTHRWSAMYNAEKKLYSYRFSVNPVMNPLERHTRWHIDHYKINLEKLACLLRSFEGEHDFRAFAGGMEQKEKLSGSTISTVRTVHSVDLVNEGHGNYRIDFILVGALYKMVRNMVGTSLEVCKEHGVGRIDEAKFLQLLHQKTDDDRKTQFWRINNPCKPAPPEGLTLERVFYNDDITF